jgi:hypothetical protein
MKSTPVTGRDVVSRQSANVAGKQGSSIDCATCSDDIDRTTVNM